MIQNEIDLWGGYLGGDSYRNMRKVVNFQNPYIQGAMFVASFLPWGAALRGLGLVAKLSKLGRGLAALGRGMATKAGKFLKGAAAWNRRNRGGFIKLPGKAAPNVSGHALAKARAIGFTGTDAEIGGKIIGLYDKGNKFWDNKWNRVSSIVRRYNPGAKSSDLYMGYDRDSNIITTVFWTRFNRNQTWYGNWRWNPLF